MMLVDLEFEWDDQKNLMNQAKHGIDFVIAQMAFADPHRIILYDANHSQDEQRWFCLGKVEDKVLTVRFTIRENKIRIIGAGCWRQWSKFYDERSK